MSVFKCKMCGGSLEVEKGQTICECEYCGTKQTLPKLDDDKKANLYDRANHFRRNNEYDKAMGIYETILAEDTSDAEAYWSLVLCKYGVEYIDDPSIHKKVPTVNRAQFTSIFSDEDYKSAIKYADGYQREIYEQEARAIDEIQKGILAISSKEEPFDVFICYKETGNDGRRTPDSVLATELYNELRREGFKVFFSRITLEDKLGTAYEPYIFAALNSAKVMVVVGTKPEYFNAVWVKNEWSRYLALIKNGAKKMLIPAYKDMDPYDLPEEFSHLQAQDMSKLGFMHDLVHAIKKIINVDEVGKQKTVVINNVNTNIEPLLKRMFMFLEDGEWQRADDFAEQVLNQDPENSYAYLGKLMADLKIKKQDLLGKYEAGFENNPNYNKIRRYADKTLNDKLDEYIKNIESIKAEKAYQHSVKLMESAVTEKEFLQAADSFESHSDYKDSKKLAVECRSKVAEKTYQHSVKLMESAVTEKEFLQAADSFESYGDYKDSKELALECRNKAVESRKESIYLTAFYNMKTDDISKLNLAIEFFNKFPDYKDSAEQISVCKSRIEKIKNESERKAEEKRIEIKKRKKKVKRTILSVILVLCVFIAFIISLIFIIIPNNKYKAAVKMMDNENYDDAIAVFDELDGYKDSESLLEKCYLEKYGEEKLNEIKNIKVGDTYVFGTYEQDNNKSNGKEPIEWIVLDKKDMSLLLISKYALDSYFYYVAETADAGIEWKNSSIREWLNDDFFNRAFNADEQAKIQKTINKDDLNDKIFLLSTNEAKKYFSVGNERICEPTNYAASSKGIGYTLGGTYSCSWWLRSTSNSHPNRAACVDIDGIVDPDGTGISSSCGVRPAMWISIN